MPRVFYDGQVFTQQARGGVSRYFVNLARSVNDLPGWDATVSLGVHVLEEIPEDLRTSGPSLKWPTTKGIRMRHVINRNLMALARPEVLRESVYHPTWYDTATIDVWNELPIVLTVHDVIPETWTQLSETGQVEDRAASFRRARIIACVSQATSDEFTRLFPELSDRVVVCYPGLSPLPQGSKSQSSGSYLVHVGKRGGYKDFDTALRGMALLPEEISLVAVGGEPVGATEERLVADLGLSDRVEFRSGVDDQQLADLLAGASALVSVSRAEGFGFPPIEAAAQRTPSILSDIPPYVEIHGRWAEFFPAGDHEAFAQVTERTLAAAKRTDLPSTESIGEEFSWRHAAEQMARAYESALS